MKKVAKLNYQNLKLI